MANKYDLVAFHQALATDTKMAYSIGGAVPADKTRFVTFLRIELTEELQSNSSGVTGVLGVASNLTALSAISDIAAALSGAVIPMHLAEASGANPGYINKQIMNQMPDRPDMDHPLLSVGAGKYLYYGLSDAPAASIFVQYYDE